jgi:Ca-activated chloride channel family protein
MTLGSPWFLLGTLVALLYGAILLVAGIRGRKARERFGDEGRVRALMTHDPSKRRAFRGVFLVLATALAFVAAARPQYGGQKVLVPATKVDIVIALDFSKSMYARDVEPSRIFRAKAEVADLIQSLPGVRFGAVAFAGEAMSFPMTADGAAIAAFFRGIEPNDMPVGGTSLTRALDAARDLLNRDPKSKDHRRFVILVTDGEDLDGSPLSVARSLGDDETTVHVVQIGGRTPERIPEVGPNGEVTGWRRDERGEYMTTELTARGEAQLASIAKASPGGKVVRAERGRTGIEEISAELKDAMKGGEYSEHYEEVFADVYEYPLGLAIILLLLEALIADAPKFRFFRNKPPAKAETKPMPWARRTT